MHLLSELGEDAVLQRLLQSLPTNDALLIGAGDDCAVAARNAEWDSLLKTDVVVEGVHFLRETAPERIGRKALARPLSDIAAMGGYPEHALVTLLVHPSRSVELLEGLYRGMNKLAQRYGISLAGGETASLPCDGLVINVAVVGKVKRGQAILRSGGRPDDLIFVSGVLGGSFPTEWHLDFEPRLDLAQSLLHAGIRPTAMMDISDGLGSDLPRLAAASHCTFELDVDALPCRSGFTPRQAISDGEDYELLLTLSPQDAEKLPATPLSTPLTCIGRLTSERRSSLPVGWQHFRA